MGDKNILICLERLDIGGVETVVINQVNHLLRLHYKVTILARKGIYSELLEKKGVNCIDFDFGLEDKFNIEKANEISKIIKKYEIGQVYIHQFPCILSVFPACMMCNVPYVAYLHMILDGVCQWFCNTYPIYEYAFPMYFKCAHKLIAITEKTKNYIINQFGMDSNKFLVLHNSLDFEELETMEKRKINKIEKFLIISRLAVEKEQSIKNAINIFYEFNKTNEDAFLTIMGDGAIREKIENYINEKQISNVEFIGSKNNVMEYIDKNDVVIGLDRCILETMAMKKIAIIAGYDKIGGMVCKENIQQAEEENFSGNNLKGCTLEEVVLTLNNLSVEQIDNMIEENYAYIYQHLNMKDNCYLIEPKEVNTNAYEEFFKGINEFDEEIKNLKIECENLKQRDKNEFIKQINQKEERIKNLEEELEKVYSSKRWKYTEKISKMFH